MLTLWPVKREHVDAHQTVAKISICIYKRMVIQFLTTESHIAALVEDCRSRVMTRCSCPEERMHLEAGLSQLKDYLKECLPVQNPSELSAEHRTECLDILSSYSQKWKSYLDMINSNPNLSANIRKSDTSDHEYSWTGIDIRVRGRGQPDDKIYQQDAFARQYVPRGVFLLHLTRLDSLECDLVLPLLRAFPKFSGVEDSEPMSPSTERLSEDTRRFFSQPLENTATIVRTTKANGEAAHLAIYYGLAGSYVYIMGSKNVHLVLTQESEIEEYRQDPAYRGAVAIASAMFQLLDHLSLDTRENLCRFLAQSYLTASFEFLSLEHQHIELLTQSRLLFLGFTRSSSLDWRMPLNSIFGFKLAASLGLECVEYTYSSYLGPELHRNTIDQYIRETMGEEGQVLVYIDSRGQVIGLEKIKSAWYVALRAIREQVKRMCRQAAKGHTNALGDVLVRVRQRFQSIQHFLNLTSIQSAHYCALGHQFCHFIHDKLVHESSEQLLNRVSDEFPLLWQEFCQQDHVEEHFSSS